MPKKEETKKEEVINNVEKKSSFVHVAKFLKKPVVTEKSGFLTQNNNEYVFKVDMSADKGNIKKSIQDLYNVVVERVNTITRKGKSTGFRNKKGKKSDEKIAIVKIKKGQTIDVFKN